MLLDVSHTCHTSAQTGIQKVVRSLARHLPAPHPVTYDPWSRAWRPLVPSEQERLYHPGQAGGRRGAAWPLGQKVQGLAERWLARRRTPQLRRLPLDGPLLVPELFTAEVGRALPVLRRACAGASVAVFHDAIALQNPTWSAHATVARFPQYLLELADFDGVAAISEASRQCLLDYWAWAGVENPPPVHTLPLGIDLPSAVPPLPTGEFTLLSVGTLEGRKNHLSLLEACERLWAEGQRFRLVLVGRVQKQTGQAALAALADAQRRGRPLTYRGPVDEAALAQAYAECHATVYPSWSEGFGLPVLEALARGRPCVVSAQGALGESSQGGGCLTVGEPTAEALTEALRRLLTDRSLRARLHEELSQRHFRTWGQYATELAAWASHLPRRSR